MRKEILWFSAWEDVHEGRKFGECGSGCGGSMVSGHCICSRGDRWMLVHSVLSLLFPLVQLGTPGCWQVSPSVRPLWKHPQTCLDVRLLRDSKSNEAAVVTDKYFYRKGCQNWNKALFKEWLVAYRKSTTREESERGCMSYQLVKEFGGKIIMSYSCWFILQKVNLFGLCLSGRALVWQAKGLSLIPWAANKQTNKNKPSISEERPAWWCSDRSQQLLFLQLVTE